jgi:hypothetical protein
MSDSFSSSISLLDWKSLKSAKKILVLTLFGPPKHQKLDHFPMAGQRNYAKNLAALAILESQKLPLRPLFKTVQFQENLMGGV